MCDADAVTPDGTGAETMLLLVPLRGAEGPPWKVRLDDDLLKLLTGDGRTVMMLPREESVRHVKFHWDLRHGRTVAFVLAEGLRAYTFKCGAAVQRELVAWLPHKSDAELEREIRHYGAALVLVGLVQLLLPRYFFAGWGLALQLLGLANVLWPKRVLFIVNGAVLLLIGLVTLFFRSPLGIEAEADARIAQVLAMALGSILLVWGIQQFSLLSVNQRLRPPDTASESGTASTQPKRSRTVGRVAWAALAFSLLLGGHAAGLLFQAGMDYSLTEMTLYMVPMLVLLASACALWLRVRPSYFEAKLTAQFLVVLATFYIVGFAVCLRGGTAPFPAGAMQSGFEMGARPYVWLPIIAFVLLLNRWLARAAKRELDEQDG